MSNPLTATDEINSNLRLRDVQQGPGTLVGIHAQYTSMPAIQQQLQRRYEVSPDGPDFSHMAIILGCLGVLLIFICIVAFFIRLQPKRPRSFPSATMPIEGQHADESPHRQNIPMAIIDGDVRVVAAVQECGDLPKYQAAESTSQQHDLPPAYESMEVWQSREAQIKSQKRNWTSIWPFRSTQTG